MAFVATDRRRRIARKKRIATVGFGARVGALTNETGAGCQCPVDREYYDGLHSGSPADQLRRRSARVPPGNYARIHNTTGESAMDCHCNVRPAGLERKQQVGSERR
jgi:hypothetical protein